MELFEMDLGPMGAPGFQLRDRIDMSGHNSGNVAPHLNTDLMRGDTPMRGQFKDLCNNQFPGMNNMINP